LKKTFEKKNRKKKREKKKLAKKKGKESLWITVVIHSDLGLGEQ
jgi:hypothetical protein